MTSTVTPSGCLLFTTLLLAGVFPSSSFEEPEVLFDLHLSSSINTSQSCRDDDSCMIGFSDSDCLSFGICHFKCPDGSRTNFPEVFMPANSTTCQDDLICGLPEAVDQFNGRYYVDGSMASPCSITSSLISEGLIRPFTISFWVQGFCYPSCTLLTVGDNDVVLIEGAISLNDESPSEWPNVSGMNWTHVVITQRTTGEPVDVYIDNDRQESNIVIRPPSGDVTPIEIGPSEALNSTSDFYRLVDVRIYEDSLSDREIEALFTGTMSSVPDVPECRCPSSHPAVESGGSNCTDGTTSISRLEVEFYDTDAILDDDDSTSWASVASSTVFLNIDLGNSFQVTELNVIFNETGATPLLSVWELVSADGIASTFYTCDVAGCVLNSTHVDDTNYRDSMIRYIGVGFPNLSPLSFIIQSIEIQGRCDCGGVASQCVKVAGSADYRCECENNTVGPHCEDCQTPYYRLTDSELQCRGVCRCNPLHSLSCDQIGGRCTCKENVADGYCDSCKSFAYNLTESNPKGCDECNWCNTTGSYNCRPYGICYCRRNVTGENCDRCVEGHYWRARTSHYVCSSCDCDLNGTVSVADTCDMHTGQCYCKPNVQGWYCDECKDGFYNLTDTNEDGCSPCECYLNGTVDGDYTCNNDTGDCLCLDNFQGRQCDQCSEGYYNMTGSDDECIPCNCYTNGTVNASVSCDDKGQCDCIANVSGLRCDRCADTFFELEVGDIESCSPCECDVIGSTNSGLCDAAGNCSCKPNVKGPKCDACVPGFFNLTEASDGCLPCECDPEGSTSNICDYVTGQCQCKLAVTGRQCDVCFDRFFGFGSDDSNGCSPCHCNTSNTVGGSDVCNETGHCDCIPNVPGPTCDTCEDGYFDLASGCLPCDCHDAGSVDGICDKETGECSCQQNVTGWKCDTCLSLTFNLSLTGCEPCDCHDFGAESCDNVTGTCVCRPNVNGSRCDECSEWYYGIDSGYGCFACNCDEAGTESCNVTNGQCECKDNVDGAQCEYCTFEYFNLTKENDGCLPCECDPLGSNDTACNDTGDCLCKTFVTGRHCDVCMEGHFGLGSDDYNGCSFCNCNTSNTVGGSDLCNETGQCDCIPNVQGPTCDTCEDGYFDLASGCLPCDCHDTGSIDGICDKETGECSCQQNVTGWKCDTCMSLTFDLSSTGCEPCDCHDFGAETCDNVTGTCVCRPNVNGSRCDECFEWYYGIESGFGCFACNCDVAGTESCNVTSGQCECKDNVDGLQCDVCTDGYHSMDKENGTGCIPCACDPTGSTSNMCDKDSGACSCRNNVEGFACDQCQAMTYELTLVGCKDCNCYSFGTESCDNVTGTCNCHPNVTGSRCDRCIDDHFGIESNSGCLPCTPDVSNTECDVYTSTTTASPIASANLGEDCQSAYCGTTNSACVTKSDSSRICECQAKYIQINDTICQKGPKVITGPSEYTFPVSRGNNDTEFLIPFDGLAGNQDLMNVSADVIPKQENIILNISTNELTLAFTSDTMTSSAFAVVLSGESLVGSFSVQQVVRVQIEVAADDFVHQIQVLLLSGTRPKTQMVQMRSPSHISIENKFTFGMKSESDDLQSLFSVDEYTGAVTTSNHVTLGKDVLAKDYSFNVTKTAKNGTQKTVAIVNVLVVRDDAMVTVEEGYTGDLLSLDLSSGAFTISLKDSYPGITMGSESVLLDTPRDYQRDEILTKVELDVESVNIEDSAQTTLTFTLRINDTNDKRPIFSTASRDVFFPAESPSGSIIAVVSAVDPDTVGIVTYSLHGPYSSKFQVDKSGVITALHSLKRSDFGDNFPLEVKASDGINDSKNNISVQVSLYALQKTIEKDLNMTFMVNVKEHYGIGEPVLDVSAQAANYSDFHFLYPTTNLPFFLNSSTGIVSLKRVIDREEFHNWFENLEIGGFHNIDKCNPVKIGELVVTIIDINDNHPTFSENKYEGDIEEESVTSVGVNIEIWDEDIGPNANLTISSNDSTFDLRYKDDQVIIKPKAPLDRENVSRYVMELTAVDSPINGDPQLTGSAIVVIRVTDINDNDPEFVNASTELFITENASPRQLTRFRATDKDEGVNGDIRFELLSGGLGFFDLKDTGELSTTKEVDREEVDRFDLVVSASDKGLYDTRRVRNITVTVYVRDVNDNPPKFDNRVNVFERFENVSSLNVSVKAYDPDVNGTVRYMLNHPRFSIDETTGAVALTSELDYESETIFNFTVSAVDNGNNSLTSETTVFILVKDVNDNAPVFSNIIVENALDASDLHTDQFVMHVEVADADSGRNAEVNLSISSPNSKWFKFESGSSGFLQLSRTDITAGSYDINITATDKGNPPLSSSKSVELVVHNNLTGQSNIQFMTISLPEGNYSGETIGNVSEAIDGNQTTYQVARAPPGVFVVNETSGDITCTGAVDRETKEQYLLLVNTSYTEGGVEVTRRVLVILDILDENDNFPHFAPDIVNTNVIPEDAINNTFVQALSVTDLDAGQNGVAGLHYSIINTDTPFAVNATTGDLTTRGELDRETQDSYLVRVQVRDGGTPPKSATANINISLIDINDNSPSFTKDLYVFNVPENTTVGTNLEEKISASDPDFAHNGTVSFMDTDPNLCPFSLETEWNDLSSNGVLKLNAQLDFETTSTYQCNVSAVDDMGCEDGCPYQRRTNATIRIVVLNINDERPVFQGAPYKANVTREEVPGYVIIDAISATDKDTGYGNNNVSYKILDYQEFFTLNGLSGVLTVRSDLTQLQEDTVKIQVVAFDNPAEDDPLSATTSIEIVIIDTNNRPWFQNGPYTVDITEEEITSAPWDYRALDTIDEKNVTCNCTYTIIPSDFSTFFTINEAGLVSQMQAIDREKTGSSIRLEVNATDREIPRKSVTAGLYIRVKDIDDNQPYFTKPFFAFFVNETLAVGAVIGQLDAVDEDEGGNAVIMYSAIDHDMDTRLTLEKNGTIKVREELRKKNESTENITFAVSVEKGSTSSGIAQVRIAVDLPDPNTAPSFVRGIFETEIQFLSPKGTSIKVDNFTATDPDGDTLTYKVTAGNTRNIIDMNNETGRMKLNYDLDSTIGSVINLTVEATDNNIRPKTGSCMVLITVVGLEPTACIAERQLQIDSEQREIYLGLFIGMSVLLAVAFMATICTCYKWRAAKSKSDFYKTQLKDTGDSGKKTKSVQPEQYKGHAYSGLDVSKRAESNDYDRSAVMRDFSRQSVHNPGYVKHDADKRRCAPPPEPEPDYNEYSNPSPAINPNFLSRSMPVAPNYKPSVYLPTQSYRQDRF